MADNYRITIRTDRETADAFRDLAIDEEISLGEMLYYMVDDWTEEVDASDLISDYSAEDLISLYCN